MDRLRDGYDPRVRPSFGGRRVDVGVSAYILSVYDLNEAEMSFNVDMYFRQFWLDPRLSFDSSSLERLVITDEGPASDFFWKPDTFIVNSIEEGRTRGNVFRNKFIRILPTGEVLYSRRYAHTLHEANFVMIALGLEFR